MSSVIHTIGHSNHSIQEFIELLHQHSITAIADVRSTPYSRWVPQYSSEALKKALTNADIAYVFLGKELGARSNNISCYVQGKVQYDRLAKEANFHEGIKRITQGMNNYQIALMCVEKDPINCHRALLVARKLFESGIPINHIHYDGSLETHNAMEIRLLEMCKLPQDDMFKPQKDFIIEAYAIQGERVAYQDESMELNDKMEIL
ncbi:MAG: hypothetical protein UT30_C0026G0006 [Candidatus Uhrbacteria bacterium GW2011_GWF2_39_13]|uniref:DUF488 domain-containing protein n=1 Tax=Candidatus Uhrbacteria bacterium GW2011_GWF2_39_13 TaxID=1618995 RepID=A0A0G0MSY5_9BACT|nr:MAG: hypothetical protein UT30_C0026G0006 [Candidatus Uhrbacteria bacterium GW2011_GWF2_39_13]